MLNAMTQLRKKFKKKRRPVPSSLLVSLEKEAAEKGKNGSKQH